MISQFQVFFAGLGPLLMTNFLGLGLTAALAFLGWGMPLFRKWLWIAAALTLFSTTAYNLGVKHEYSRMEAQRVLREEQFGKELDAARNQARATVARRAAAGSNTGWLRRKPGADQYDRAQ